MSDVKEQLTMEDIRNLSKNITPDVGEPTGIKDFITKSRQLYNTMLKSIPTIDNLSDKNQECMDLLELAEIIYTTEKTACSFEGKYSEINGLPFTTLSSSFYCGQNVERILNSIKYCSANGTKIEQYNLIQMRAIMSAIIGQYSCDDVEAVGETPARVCDVILPEVVKNLKKLRKERDQYFQQQCKELIEFEEVPGSSPPKYTILLHSGFKRRVLGVRPGPSPISSDKDGVFICKLRKAIIEFLHYYNISYKKSERFDDFNNDCDAATGSATNLQTSSHDSTYGSTYGSTRPATNLQTSSQDSTRLSQQLSSAAIKKGYEAYLGHAINQTTGGRLSRRRKAYKTTRRNNKYKNKKQYRRKRHTKKYKKSHRKSRR